MGEAVPLSYFKTEDGGLKLYKDKDCNYEETIDETNIIQKVYKVKVPNIIRGKKKHTTRYIKNAGFDQLLYAIFPAEVENVKVTFRLNDGEERDLANGIMLPSMINKLDIFVDVPSIGDEPEVLLGIATKPIL